MSGMMLKWIALILMLLDHLGEFFPQAVPLWFRYLGRLSAPLFFFCLAKGLEKTRSRKNYIKRLWLGSVVMGCGNFILTMLYPDAPVKVNNNIFSTMVVIGVSVWIFESFDDNCKRKDRLQRPEAALGIFLGAQICLWLLSDKIVKFGKHWARLLCAFLPNAAYCEGKIDVVILGLILYFCKNSRKKLSIGYLIYCAVQLYSSFTRAAGYGDFTMIYRYFYQWMMVGSLPLMLCYNGERGRGGTLAKRFFYFFYPAHIWILFVLSNVMK